MTQIMSILLLCSAMSEPEMVDDGTLLIGTVDPNDGISEHWRTAALCGVNSAYLFLHIHSVDVDYDALKNEMRPRRDGSSLQEICTSIRRRNVNVVAAKSRSPDPSALPFPFIAHLDKGNAAPGGIGGGHFVVVVSADRAEVLLLDGTTAAVKVVERDLFVRDWSGYAIVLDKKSRALMLVASGALPFVAILSLCVGFAVARSKARDRATSLSRTDARKDVT